MSTPNVFPQTDDRIRIVVTDGTRMASQLLSDALRRTGRFDVIASASSSAELFSALAGSAVEVAVISPNLDDEDGKGFTVTRQLRASHPHIKVVILLDSATREEVVEAFRVGARGVFCRAHSDIKVLCKCIECVHKGQIWASTNEMEFVLEALGKALPSRLVDSKGIGLLSRREQDVIRSLSEGLTNREIAAQLKLSEHTVKNYLLRIFDKLGVSNRAEAILYAFSQSGPALDPNGNSAEEMFLQGTEALFEKFQEAAERGSGVAQFYLGQMYRDGYGVPEDKLSAYTWFLLAERAGDYPEKKIREAKEQLAAKMKTDQIAQAQRRALAWIKQHGDSQPSAHVPANGKGSLEAAYAPERGFSAKQPPRARPFTPRPIDSQPAKAIGVAPR